MPLEGITCYWGVYENMQVKDIKMLKSQIFGLTIECPYGGNPCDCQLNEIRQLTLQEKMEWVNSLTENELRQLHGKHEQCFNAKKS